jgi:hypothetical protein
VYFVTKKVVGVFVFRYALPVIWVCPANAAEDAVRAKTTCVSLSGLEANLIFSSSFLQHSQGKLISFLPHLLPPTASFRMMALQRSHTNPSILTNPFFTFYSSIHPQFHNSPSFNKIQDLSKIE